MSVVNEQIFEEMMLRNQARAKKCAALLGEKWLLHPANRVEKIRQKHSVLEAPKFLIKEGAHQ
jgi:hypothetical protein